MKTSDRRTAALHGRHPLVGSLLIVLAVLVCYQPAVNGGFIWDDESYLTENSLLKTPGGLAAIWTAPRSSPQYYPMVFTSFWIEYRLWGLKPQGYHLVNIILHAMSGVILWRVLALLGLPAALPAALLFALHPVQVESVAWITERKNVLSGLFYFLSMLAYLRYGGFGPSTGAPGSPRPQALYALSLSSFILALLSKSVTATLPAALLIIVWWRRRRIPRRDVVPLTPFFALGAASGLLTAWLESSHVGASGAAFNFSVGDRIIIAGRVFWFYLGKLLWPVNLTFTYPRWDIDAAVWWHYLFPAAVLTLLAVLWWQRPRLGPGPLTAFLLFTVTLAPVLGFLNFYPMLFSFTADHFQYLACVAPLALAATLIVRPKKSGAVVSRGVIMAMILVVMGALTWRQCRIYHDPETLYADTVKKNPGAWMARINLAKYLAEGGRFAEAAHNYREVMRQRPNSGQAALGLGNIMWRQGRAEEAAAYYREALRIEPSSVDALNNLASALIRLGRREEGRSLLDKALGIDSTNALVLRQLGNMALAEGRPADAATYYERGLRASPDDPGILVELGLLQAARGRLAEAETLLRRASLLAPDDATIVYNLGVLLMQQGRPGEARACFATAVRLDPNYDKARRKLEQISPR